jgi:hypothetical protein
MIANDYPVSFPYGATTPPYTPTHPHRGDDRACPLGTPIVIGGVTIGLTGATGKVTGPHLHIQEWFGNVVTGTRKPQNAFKGGTVVNIDPLQTQGDGSFGKFITIKTSDGWNDSYCHLSSINVRIGQVLEGEEMFNEGDARNFNEYFYGKDNGRFRDQIGKDWKTASYNIMELLKAEKQLLTNAGDVGNFAKKGITLATNTAWKDAAYNAKYPSGTPTILAKGDYRVV